MDEISGLALIKVIDKDAQNTMMIKLKFTWNIPMLDVTYSSPDTVIFEPKEILGILDLRSVGYHKIKQGILQQNLSRYYRFELADVLCKQFNKSINTLKKGRKEETKEKYPWLDPSNERKYMSDKEILEKYIDLEISCLTDKEKKEVMDILYKYKEVSSLRDEISTCPNIEVQIDIRDKLPFFLRSYHVKEEDKILNTRK